MTPDEVTGDEAAELLTLDPDRSTLTFACGVKGTGKSHFSTTLFRGYPYDRILIDSTGDVDPWHDFTTPAPTAPPEDWDDLGTEEGQRQSLRVRPNRRDAVRVTEGPYERVPRWKVNIDKWIGAAMDHGRTALEIDDAATVLAVNRVLPCADEFLHELRHRNVSAFVNTIRPVGIDTLVITQADFVAVFDLTHELDLRRLAPCIGLGVDELYSLVKQLDEHEFLLRVASSKELLHCDPLPF